MDNPNPIYYKDLITPDESIKNLIEQLTTVVAQYDTLKQKIQKDAADMAASMKNVSSATEEQRKTIQQTTEQSDRLAQQYANISDKQRQANRELLNANRAKKEQQQIDKLIVQLNNSAEGSYNRLSAQYRLNKIRLNEMSEAERQGTKAGKDLETETRQIYERMSELQKATGKYTLEVGHYENAMKALPGPLRTVSEGFSNMRQQIVSIGKSDLPLGAKALQGFSTVMFGTVGIILSFVRYLSSAARTMREFEQANADLSTILGVTRDEMKGLTDSALSLGRTTEYTASQVTQLQTELAKLGFGQGSIIAMQKYVLQFATAVGANLSEAAEVAGATLRAFHLTSAETEDTLAALAVATNNSALSFSKIKDSIGTVFPVANAYGLTVKDTAALLGALANAGFDASSAATATRNILLNLADANGKLAKRLGGTVNSFEDIMNALINLRKEGVSLNEMLEITDKRSVSAFSNFLTSAESAKELRASLEDVSGELERIEKERLNTVEGSTKLLKSAWEGLTLAFQESDGVIKDVIDDLTQLVGIIQTALFPAKSVQSSNADILTQTFQDYYKEYGGEEAKKFIDRRIKDMEITEEYWRKRSESNKFANWLGFPTRSKKETFFSENELAGARQAAQIVLEQIENDAMEAAKKAELEAEEAEEKRKSANEKAAKAAQKAAKAAKKQRIADRQAVVESINLEIAATEKGTQKMLDLRLDKVEAERQLELEKNRQRTETERIDEAKINAKYDAQKLQAEKDFAKEKSNIRQQSLQAELNGINLQLAVVKRGSDQELKLRTDANEKQRQIELEKNSQLTENLRQNEAAINAKYDKRATEIRADFYEKVAREAFNIQQELAASEFDLLEKNERQKTEFRLQQERERLQKILDLNRMNGKKLNDDQVKTIKNTMAAIDKQTKSMPYNNLYEVLGIGLDKDKQDALNTAIDATVDGINGAIDAWKQEAEAAVQAASARVSAAQSALDAEIQARNNGYANNVLQAQKELELQRQSEEKAKREREKAQKAELVADTLTQASSLITASANIWKSLSAIPVVGPGLAVGALATMWGSFALAKSKAIQATRQEIYGEGTVELLQGGSHASGHDIDMGTMPDGTRRRAEGGEYFAVINKRNSRRFGSIIPDVINSLNDGTFADKYQRANANVSVALAGTDVSRLERDVREIRQQGAHSRFVDGHGNVVEVYKNSKITILK